MANTSLDIQINYRGLVRLGNSLGTFLQSSENGNRGSILVGHDFRKYAENAKNALILGLLTSGIDVLDVGLCLTPMLYFAQYEFEIPAAAMLTASHNANGWTGVKMAHDYSLTFGPERMAAFRTLVEESPESLISSSKTGRYRQIDDLLQLYMEYLRSAWAKRFGNEPALKIAVETGNGTAGLVFPQLLKDFGFDVASGHVDMDWRYPNFNPDPESLPFLRSIQNLVSITDADVGICIDGDGDRLGVIDNLGRIVFSDRVGLVLSKKLVQLEGPGAIVVDVKSTSLFDRELPGCRIIWEKTGHSYIKAALSRESALAGFERSGHFFFTEPYGRGYDDACVAALFLLWVLAEAKKIGRTMADIISELPESHQSPTRQPTVPDSRKYEIVDQIRTRVQAIVEAKGEIAGLAVSEIVTTNGVRVHFVNGSWFLIRASSNTPNLSIVAETFDDDGAKLKALDVFVRELLAGFDEVGDFDSLLESLDHTAAKL